jgi:hypothetical protein
VTMKWSQKKSQSFNQVKTSAALPACRKLATQQGFSTVC